MVSERLIPTPKPSDLPTFKILVDGTAIPLTYNLMSIVVTKAVNKVASAEFQLLDGDAAEEDFAISNQADFVPGNEIEIQAGYHNENETIFKGIIIKHGLQSRRNRAAVLVVEVKDEAVKMTVGRKNGYFNGSTDSDIIKEIIDTYGLDNDVEATDVEHPEMVQYYATDWDFIVNRAEKNGKLVFNDGGKLTVKTPDFSTEPVVGVLYGASIFEFEIEMDARHQFEAVKSSAWDFAGQEMLELEGADPGVTEQGNISASDLAGVIGLSSYNLQHTGRVADTELQAWADAQLLKSRMAKIRGWVKIQGFATVKPGDLIEMDGIGERFNGIAFVSAVRHQITGENWFTFIEVGLDPKWFSEEHGVVDASAAGLVPGILGLFNGVVVQLEGDPDGEDRILVKVPVISQEEDGVWSRIATLDAGENRGSFFRPEIGDEVLVGFLNQDPRDPVVLGMLNSSAKPAPITATDDNHEKGFITRSEMKLLFDDDLVSILLETPNGNTLTISDDEGSIVLEDENGNKIEMSADGITLESAKDINLKATGDVNIEGVNISAAANAQFKAEGSAGAEVSSGATAVLKGSLVQIN